MMRLADRARLGGAALRTAWRVLDRWGLGLQARRSLLGWRMAPGLRHAVLRAQAGRPLVLQAAALHRLGLVLGVHRMLGVLYLGEGQDLRWLRARHRAGAFGGQRPMVVMAKGGPHGLARVHRHLAALCAGGGTAPVWIMASPPARAHTHVSSCRACTGSAGA